MPVIYLAAPYSPVRKTFEIGLSKPDYSEEDKKLKEERFWQINRVAAKLYKNGFTVISPITETHLLHSECNLPGTFEFWMPHNYNLILRSDMVFVLMLEGWKDSTGINGEVAFAEQKNIPVIYIDEELKIGG